MRKNTASPSSFSFFFLYATTGISGASEARRSAFECVSFASWSFSFSVSSLGARRHPPPPPPGFAVTLGSFGASLSCEHAADLGLLQLCVLLLFEVKQLSRV